MLGLGNLWLLPRTLTSYEKPQSVSYASLGPRGVCATNAIYPFDENVWKCVHTLRRLKLAGEPKISIHWLPESAQLHFNLHMWWRLIVIPAHLAIFSYSWYGLGPFLRYVRLRNMQSTLADRIPRAHPCHCYCRMMNYSDASARLLPMVNGILNI